MLILAHHDPSWVLFGLTIGVGLGLAIAWSIRFSRRR